LKGKDLKGADLRRNEYGRPIQLVGINLRIAVFIEERDA